MASTAAFLSAAGAGVDSLLAAGAGVESLLCLLPSFECSTSDFLSNTVLSRLSAFASFALLFSLTWRTVSSSLSLFLV